jgi:hypothetical protein
VRVVPGSIGDGNTTRRAASTSRRGGAASSQREAESERAPGIWTIREGESV